MMKMLVILLFTVSFMNIFGKEIAFDKIEKKDGIFYEKGDATPFTGVAKNGGENGKLSEEIVFENGNIVMYRRYHFNGVISNEVDYKDGKAEGVKREYYTDGTLLSEANYKNNQLEGIKRLYHSNGKLKSEGNYKNGKLDGTARFYKENGELEHEVNYKDGVLQSK